MGYGAYLKTDDVQNKNFGYNGPGGRYRNFYGPKLGEKYSKLSRLIAPGVEPRGHVFHLALRRLRLAAGGLRVEGTYE